MSDTAAREQLRVGRQTVPLSNTGKVLFPADGITKGDLIRYYQEIAGVMLPYLRDRPLSLARYPEGITGERIFQKNIAGTFRTGFRGPRWTRRAASCARCSPRSQPTWCIWPTRPPSSCTRCSAGPARCTSRTS